LSYDREIRVSRELQLDPGLLDPAPDGPWLRTERAGDLRERLLEDVVKDERREVGPAQGVTANEVPQTRTEELPVRDRSADRARGLAVHLGHAQERGDLCLGQMPRGAEAPEEPLDDRLGSEVAATLRCARDRVAEGVRRAARSVNRTTSTTAGDPSRIRETVRSRSATRITGIPCSRAISTSMPTPNDGVPAYAMTSPLRATRARSIS